MASRPGAMPLGLSGADPIPFGCWAWGGGLGGAGLGSAGDLSRPPTPTPVLKAVEGKHFILPVNLRAYHKVWPYVYAQWILLNERMSEC